MGEYICENDAILESFCRRRSLNDIQCEFERKYFCRNLSFSSTSNTKTISSNSSNYLFYTNKIIDKSVNPPQSYEINGVVQKTKDGNKVLLNFNGSGYRTVTFTDSEGKTIETTYKVYSKMQGELCNNGNIKIILDEENGETTNAKEDGKDIVYDSTYSSESSFCLKKVK